MRKKYDVIIVGAGIGGLTCGCYLAKGGLKVLVVERNANPGGYCVSFNRKKLLFDACAHSLGSCRRGGNIDVLLKDFNLKNNIKLKRYNPTDIVITPEHKVIFYSKIKKTIQSFQENFPKEQENILKFFNILSESDDFSLLALRKKSFKNLLDSYFVDKKLKAILSFPILGNAGLAPSLISAFTAAMLYREFLLDGGYYPEEGICALPNGLTKRLKEFGGDIVFRRTVKDILIDNDRASGIVLDDGNVVTSRFVVSDCDARQTFLGLIGDSKIPKKRKEELLKMKPSLSMFVLYLGIDNTFDMPFPGGVNVWYLPNHNIERAYRCATRRTVNNISEFMFRVSPEKRTVTTFINADFKNKNFWSKNKKKFSKRLIKELEKFLPNLSMYLIYEGAATPFVLHDKTLNHDGAAYGWAATNKQSMVQGFSRKTFIKNLYLSGHWATTGIGIRGVVHSGSAVAKSILKRIR